MYFLGSTALSEMLDWRLRTLKTSWNDQYKSCVCFCQGILKLRLQGGNVLKPTQMKPLTKTWNSTQMAPLVETNQKLTPTALNLTSVRFCSFPRGGAEITKKKPSATASKRRRGLARDSYSGQRHSRIQILVALFFYLNKNRINYIWVLLDSKVNYTWVFYNPGRSNMVLRTGYDPETSKFVCPEKKKRKIKFVKFCAERWRWNLRASECEIWRHIDRSMRVAPVPGCDSIYLGIGADLISGIEVNG